MQDLGDGWLGRFDYTVTSRGWVPVALAVWQDKDETPPTGLPVRRLRELTVADDIGSLGPPPGAPALAAELTPQQRRTAAGRLQALQLYDAMRMWGMTRAQIAKRMHVSEAWLKWVLSWGRQQGYINQAGDFTESFALDFVRSQEG